VPLLGNIGDVALKASRMHRHVSVEHKGQPQRLCGEKRCRLPGLGSKVVRGWGIYGGRVGEVTDCSIDGVHIVRCFGK
jgi:hypothetical protein